MRGHSRSKGSIKALVRQLPRRTQSKRAALSAWLRDGGTIRCVGNGGVKQAAGKPLAAVILRSRRRRRISHCLENTQGAILRFAQNDSLEGFSRSL